MKLPTNRDEIQSIAVKTIVGTLVALILNAVGTLMKDSVQHEIRINRSEDKISRLEERQNDINRFVQERIDGHRTRIEKVEEKEK